jgi:PhoPQ-activated pathogenicity-related protein
VIGIAPIVFDNLDYERQIALHFETWGKPSPSIHDYTDAGLLELLQTDRGRQLVQLVDPYSYADRLDLPKLALIGTNDTYWPLDSVNIYRGGLPGEFYCHYVPNAGHGAGLSVVSAPVASRSMTT